MLSNQNAGTNSRKPRLFSKLSFRICLVTVILVVLVISLFYLPLYWHTRVTLEKQMEKQMELIIRFTTHELSPDFITNVVNYHIPVLNDSLDKILSGMVRSFPVESIYMLGRDGELIAAGGNGEQAIKSAFIHRKIITTMAKDKISFGPLFSTEEGKWFKSAFYPYPVSGRENVIIGIDASADFLSSVKDLNKRVLILAGFLMVLGIVISVLLSLTITKPLRSLERYAREIGKGFLNAKPPKNRNDEIGFLAETMDTMAHRIKRREDENKLLVASVAHEIKNPLAGMKLNLELLKEEISPNENEESIFGRIERDLHHLIFVVEQFLSFARPMDANLSESHLADIVKEAFRSVNYSGKYKLNIEGDYIISCNRNKLLSLFSNLMMNAIEAAEGIPDILVKIGLSGEYVIINFKSMGTPIPVEIQSQIFEPFFTTKADGAGLGLPIAKSVVEQHGGSMCLISSSEKGTVFEIKLPADRI